MALGLSLAGDAWATTYNVIDLGFNVYPTGISNQGQGGGIGIMVSPRCSYKEKDLPTATIRMTFLEHPGFSNLEF